MQGTLHKTDSGWIVRWSDLHSFHHGWLMMDTPIHPKAIKDNFIEGENVEFDHEIHGYDAEDYTPFKYAVITCRKGYSQA